MPAGQRRTLAPAFTPKSVGLLAPHMLGPTEEAIAELRAARGEPVNLFAAVQRLALEIAGRTMFSLEMREYSGVLRDMIGRYNARLARMHLLDIVLPVAIPSPHDIARRIFGHRWMRLFEDLMARRRQTGAAANQPRDLFDLLLAARDPETGQAFSPEQLRDQVATMIMAGHETTAVALSWALYLLALAPEVQDRAAEEARQADPPGRETAPWRSTGLYHVPTEPSPAHILPIHVPSLTRPCALPASLCDLARRAGAGRGGGRAGPTGRHH